MWQQLLIVVVGAGFGIVEPALDSNDLPQQASFRRGGFRHTLAATSQQPLWMGYHRQKTQRSKSTNGLIDISDYDYGTDMNLGHFVSEKMPHFGAYDQQNLLQIGSLSQSNLSAVRLRYGTGAVAHPVDSASPGDGHDVNNQSNSGEIVHSGSNTGEVAHSESNAEEIVHSGSTSGEIIHSGSNSDEIVHSESNSGEVVHSESNSGEIIHFIHSDSGYVSPDSESGDFALATTERCRESDVCGHITLPINQNDFSGTTPLEIGLNCDPSLQESHEGFVDDQNLVVQTEGQIVRGDMYSGMESGSPLSAETDSGVQATNDEGPSYVSLSAAFKDSDITPSFTCLDLSLIAHLLHPSYFLRNSRMLVSLAWNEPRFIQIDRVRSSPQLLERNDSLSKFTYQSFIGSMCGHILSCSRFSLILLLMDCLDLRPVTFKHLDAHEEIDENQAGCSEFSETKHEQFGTLASINLSQDNEECVYIHPKAITISGSETCDVDRNCNKNSLDEQDCRAEKLQEDYRFEEQQNVHQFQKQEEEYSSQREMIRSEKPRLFAVSPVDTSETENNGMEEVFISCELQPMSELSSESPSNSHSKLASPIALFLFVFLVCISGIVLKSRMQQRNGTGSCNDATKQGESSL